MLRCRAGSLPLVVVVLIILGSLSLLFSEVEASHPHAFPIHRVATDDDAAAAANVVVESNHVRDNEALDEEKKILEAMAQQIETVHVIFMNHLDVGKVNQNK